MSAADANRAQALEELFHRALALDPPERDAFLAAVCPDPSLREDVQALLASAGSCSLSLSRGLEAGATSWERILAEAMCDAPRGVSGYRLLRPIGAGGMGRVFLAEQEQPRRLVAVKLLHGWLSRSLPGADVTSATRRFEREVEALARLQHPGLAQVLQAGVDPEGRAWIAMRFVEGKPLIDAANDLRLGLRDRLLVLAAVCDAVQAAHGKGVIHCDLKPGNVLLDHSGQPVVLDFGIARVLAPMGPVSLHASLPRILGTLAYMSPEQLAGRRSAVDVGTDVWSLGVLLHELVTGRLPFATRGLDPVRAAQVIEDGHRVPLGDCGLAESGSTAGPAVDLRQLELVLDKALARSPADRFASASAMAEDLRRCAWGRPVLARPPSWGLRVVLFARRKPLAATWLVLALASLAGGMSFSAISWVRAGRDEMRAAQAVEDLVRLSDQRTLQELQASAAALWPVSPASESDQQSLVNRAAALLGRLPVHRARLDQLLHASDREAPGLAARWELSLLAELVPAMVKLADPRPSVGLLTDLERRLSYVRAVEAATLVAPAAEWARAAESIAADPRFGGCVLEPQVGLVPLGPDPRSGLQEFALWSWTGTVPERDPFTGDLRLDDGAAIVLVLVPGGRVLLGSQAGDPQGRRHVRSARANEAPLVEVDLAPCFMSKCEVSQAQYERVMGRNPSRQPGPDLVPPRLWPQLPVNGLSWLDAHEFARRVGCGLPTEAQWEHAARAGSDAPWWPGEEWSRLQGAMNVADRSMLPAENWPRDATGHVFDDGHPHLASVSWGERNDFGLHNVHGNVWEFCADVYRADRRGPFRLGDGLLLAEPAADEPRRHALRGGSYEERLDVARSSFRSDVISDQVVPAGIRLVRGLERRRGGG